MTAPAVLHKDRMTKAGDVEAEITSRGEEMKPSAMAKKVLKHDKLKRAQKVQADVVALCETLSGTHCECPPLTGCPIHGEAETTNPGEEVKALAMMMAKKAAKDNTSDVTGQSTMG